MVVPLSAAAPVMVAMILMNSEVMVVMLNITVVVSCTPPAVTLPVLTPTFRILFEGLDLLNVTDCPLFGSDSSGKKSHEKNLSE